MGMPAVLTDFDLQELLQRDPAAARSALRHFQSCVRTTLLLSHGYECQEKVSQRSCTILYTVFWVL